MISAWFAKIFAKVGKEIVVFGGIIAGFALLLFGHKRSVNKANKQGKTEGELKAQIEITGEAERKAAKIKEKAREIKKEIEDDTRDLDDLLRRMREESTDYDGKS